MRDQCLTNGRTIQVTLNLFCSVVIFHSINGKTCDKVMLSVLIFMQQQMRHHLAISHLSMTFIFDLENQKVSPSFHG